MHVTWTMNMQNWLVCSGISEMQVDLILLYAQVWFMKFLENVWKSLMEYVEHDCLR